MFRMFPRSFLRIKRNDRNHNIRHISSPVTLPSPKNTSAYTLLQLGSVIQLYEKELNDVGRQIASTFDDEKKISSLNQQKVKLHKDKAKWEREREFQLTDKQFQLLKACKSRDNVLVKQLLDEGFELFTKPQWIQYLNQSRNKIPYNDYINCALQADDVKTLCHLIDIERALGNRNQSLLVEAILLDAQHCAAYLITKSNNINTPYYYQIAAYRNKDGSESNVCQYHWTERGSPLALAIDRGLIEAARLLIQTKANLEVLYGNEEEVSEFYYPKGSFFSEDYTWDGICDQTALMVAIKKCEVEKNETKKVDYINLIKDLLDHGAKVDCRNRDGKTALQLTTNPEVIQILSVFMKEQEEKLSHHNPTNRMK